MEVVSLTCAFGRALRIVRRDTAPGRAGVEAWLVSAQVAGEGPLGRQVAGSTGWPDHLHSTGRAGKGHEVGVGVRGSLGVPLGRPGGKQPLGGLGEGQLIRAGRLALLNSSEGQQTGGGSEVSGAAVQDLRRQRPWLVDVALGGGDAGGRTAPASRSRAGAQGPAVPQADRSAR